MALKKLPTFFISHGGGPWPWLKKEMPFYEELEHSLQEMPRQIGSVPKAILMVSGHWETKDFTVMTHPQPPMIYDYGGFPAHTYQVKYQAPGSPELAKRVQELGQTARIQVSADSQRGFDHGAFTPLVVMYPDAQIPVVQLSMRSDLDPEAHLRMGRALSPLRDEGILIIGSGLSYHNMRGFGNPAAAGSSSNSFDQWLQDALLKSSPAQRTEKLLNWEQAPAARQTHPREDHLIPLMVAVGAAEQEPAQMVYHQENFMGAITASSFKFGD